MIALLLIYGMNILIVQATILIVETPKNIFREVKIFFGICYQDFYRYRKVKINNPMAFYNKQDSLLLTIYDDQFCDI